ncbi:hypothetical protein QBC32DRAFT_118812 [Pseudoneurospora amorphoporcata]|uniref:FAD-binding PCMH-type domain-containing protein n=1 Tax=Pseudoneurospora amorphoporcata TaxID=241081 RepID=A0AAN6P0E7_9PEZI|nr:hypothetical protein QBC32DRAFT_118812 [Pseudoneurospora amorphoporcata]
MAAPPNGRVLPPSFDINTFDKVMDAMATIVGSDNVSRDSFHGNLGGPGGELFYGDIWPMGDTTDHTPSGAIRPKSVDEVQEIVKVANRYKLPLWTVSRGKNLGYGASGAVVRGSVILDLHRMNKIIEVSEEHAYAIVEPGVSFFDLYNYIQAKGYRLWPSCPALGWGSVLGNTLERGFGYTPNGEHAEQQCGMEVMLGTGEVVRTGMGALPGSPMWPLFKGGYGPSIDGLFYQSNLGIVTKLGIHLTPAPASFALCELSVPSQDQLISMVRTLAHLERENVIQNHTSISNPFRRALADLTTCPDLVPRVLGPGLQSGGGCATNADMTALAKERGWGYWTGDFALYAASPAILDANWALVHERIAAAGISGACVKITFRADAAPNERLNASKLAVPSEYTAIPQYGVPGTQNASLMETRGGPNAKGNGHICFSPLFSTDGIEMQAWWDRAQQMAEDARFDVFADFHVYGRYVLAIALVVYRPHDEGERVKGLFERWLEDAEKHGVSEYRTHLDYMDRVRGQFNWPGGSGVGAEAGGGQERGKQDALGQVLRRLKGVLDPEGILGQGKSGIWTVPART